MLKGFFLFSLGLLFGLWIAGPKKSRSPVATELPTVEAEAREESGQEADLLKQLAALKDSCAAFEKQAPTTVSSPCPVLAPAPTAPEPQDPFPETDSTDDRPEVRDPYDETEVEATDENN